MNRTRRNELRRPDRGVAAAEAAPRVRLNDSAADRTAEAPTGSGSRRGVRSRRQAVAGAIGRAITDLLFPLVHLVVGGAVRVCFGRITTVGRERIPRRGAALLVANHPAAWTDVVVVEAALGRRIHFIAHQPLFRPWIRGLLLELFATLPVSYRSEDPESFAHNEVTFARCRAVFRKGQVVAMFPEGVSGGDRDLLPLKTGAARLLLEPASGGEHPQLIPIGIHYRDRTAFRTPVVVAVGPPIGFAMHCSGAGDPDAAVHALTDDMARAIAASMAAAAMEAHGGAPGSGRDATGRRQAFEALAALAMAAAVGRALHAVPLWGIERAARSLADQPQQIAFGRMVSGLVLIPLWYALLVGLAAALGGGAWFLVPASAPALGALACREHDRRLRATRPLP